MSEVIGSTDYRAFPGPDWWHMRPWNINPDQALAEVPIGDPPDAWVTLLGGPDGWDEIVRLDFLMRSESRNETVEYTYRDYERLSQRLDGPRRDDPSTDYVRVFPIHRPLHGWDRANMHEIIDAAYRILYDFDEIYRVGQALREARVGLTGEVVAPSAGLRRRSISDEGFVVIYEIVSKRHGYAQIMADMLDVSRQTVMNRVNQLRKQGLIEPATTRGNT